ncbi:MAG: MMPL family transporter [Myxococcota bacterium]
MLRLARFSIRHPGATLALLAAATLVLGAGVLRLETDVGYRAFLGARHAAIVELDAFVERFGAGLPVAAVWSCEESAACEHVFDEASLGMAYRVANALADVAGVLRVDSPATTGLLVPSSFGLPQARRLAPGGQPADDVAVLAERALADPTWVHQIVSSDGRAGAVLVYLESSAGGTSRRVFEALSRALDEPRAAGFEFYLVGGPVEFVVAGADLQRHSARIIPVMVALVGAILLLLFRSWIAAAISLGAVGVAVVWTFGAMGWLGWPQNSLTQALAPLILVIGVCDSIHVLSRFVAHAALDQPDERVLRACSEVGPACLMTTLTTAAGFASFATSELETFVRFGLSAALGVTAALLLSFSLLPIALVRLRTGQLSGGGANAAWDRALSALVGWAGARKLEILAATSLMFLLSLWGVTQLRVEASFEDLYGEDSQVVRWARAVATHLREPDTLEIELRPPAETELASSAVLSVVSALERQLPEVDGLGATLSVLDPLRTLHRLVHRGELDVDAPGERSAGLLRLLRAEDPAGLALLVDLDGHALRLSAQAEKLPQERLFASLARVRGLLADELPVAWGVVVTGPLAVVQVMIEAVSRTQLRSFTVALAIVLGLVATYFRSLRTAALALIPTLLPVVLTLGAMGALGVRLDVGTAMVAAVILGLAIDDALHVIAPYRARRVAGESSGDAIVAVVRSRGRALCTTSFALTAGFFALTLSPWKSIASFGLVSGIAILGALAADLLVLPALLLAADRTRGRRIVRPAEPSR